MSYTMREEKNEQNVNSHKFNGVFFDVPRSVKADSEGEFYIPVCEEIVYLIKEFESIGAHVDDNVLLVRFMFDDQFYDMIAYYEDYTVFFPEFMSGIHKAGIKAVVPISFAIDVFLYNYNHHEI